MKDLIKKLFYFLVIATPLYFNFLPRDPFEINKITIVYIVTAIIFVLWVVDILKNKKLKIPGSFIILFAFIYLFFNALSLIFSIHPYTSLFGNYWRMSDGFLSLANYFILFIILSATVFSSKENERKSFIDTILSFIVATSALVSIVGILQYLNINLFGLTQDASRVISTIGQPNFLGAYLLFSLPIILLFLVNTKKIWLRILVLLILVLEVATLILTLSRSAWLGLFVLMIFLGVYYLKKSEKPRKTFVLALGIIAICFTIFSGPILSRMSFINKDLFKQDRFNAENLISRVLTSRYFAWKGAIDIAKNNPLLGTGPETFLFSFPKYRDPRLDQTEIVWGIKFDKAHNDLLNIAANTGLLSLISYMAMIFFMFFSLRKMKKGSWEKQYLVFFCGAELAFLVSGLFGFPSVSANLYFWIILGIIVGLSSESWAIDHEFKNKKRFIPLVALFAITSLVLVYSSLFSFNNYMADVYFNKGYREMAVRLNPYLDFYRGNLALEYLARGDKERALLEAKKTVELNKYNADNVLVLVIVYKSFEGTYKNEILESYDKALELEPRNPKTHFERAEYLISIDNREGALDSLDKALELKPGYPGAENLLKSL